MSMVQKKHANKCFMVSYEDSFPEAKRYAEAKLDEQIQYFDEQMRIANLTVDQYLDELYHRRVAKCPYCRSLDTVIRRDRIRLLNALDRLGLGHIFEGDKVSPYRRCNNCGNDFEQSDFDKELMRKEAKAKHARATNATKGEI